MKEDVFNTSIRKLLKEFGVTAQREIEKAVRQAVAEHRLKGRRGWRRGGEQRSLFGDSGLAQAFKNRLKLSQIRRVVALCRPGGSAAGDRVGRVEGETGPDRRTRFVNSPQLRQGGGQV
jgi:hypothetical protein